MPAAPPGGAVPLADGQAAHHREVHAPVHRHGHGRSPGLHHAPGSHDARAAGPGENACIECLYTDMGMDVLQVSISPLDLLMPVQRTQVRMPVQNDCENACIEYLYTDMGMDVLQVSISPLDLLMPVQRAQGVSFSPGNTNLNLARSGCPRCFDGFTPS